MHSSQKTWVHFVTMTGSSGTDRQIGQNRSLGTSSGWRRVAIIFKIGANNVVFFLWLCDSCVIFSSRFSISDSEKKLL